MHKIALTFEKPTIEINGVVFDVLRSDAAMVQDMLDIDAQFADRDTSSPAVALEKNTVMLAYLDTLFGEGAEQKIRDSIDGLDGYGLGMAGVSALLANIVAGAGKAYAEAIRLKYDDD